MEEEIWKDIPGYEGLYQISTIGRVICSLTMRIKATRNRNGYRCVTLHKNGERKTFSVHRLVAIAFITNPNNLPFINHKDENRANNRVDNLEWCDASYNNKYGTRPRKVLDANKANGSIVAEKKVAKIGRNGTVLDVYNSISEAARQNGVTREAIRNCVNGRTMKSCGYKWTFIN